MKRYDEEKEIANYIANIITTGDNSVNEKYEQWLRDNKYSYQIIKNLSSADIDSKIANFKESEIKKMAMAKSLEKKLHRISLRKQFIKISISAAACILISIGVAIFQSDIQESAKFTHIEQPPLNNLDILPNRVEEPTLIKASGHKLNLSSVKNIIITDNTEIIKTASNRIQVSSIEQKIETNCLIVPKMTSYEIILSDGTKVKLNANSRLIFPNKFTGKFREVTLYGEAYFDVSKSSKQFIVNTVGASIKVYGTKFSVNNYDSNNIKAYLVEGSIALHYNKNEVMIKPNELVNVNKTRHKINVVRDIYVEKYIGWVNNNFVFSENTLEEIAVILSNWYGYKISCLKPNSKIRLNAQYGMDTPLKEIIRSIEHIVGEKSLIYMPMDK